MSLLPKIQHAWLWVEEGRISGWGRMEDLDPAVVARANEEVDLSGKTVVPGFCDSHTHLVFARWRESEFVDRIQGLTYEEIARNGGGILNSAARLAETDEDTLFDDALQRLESLTRYGTVAVEIKSGYGLTTDAELKMLRVIKRLKKASPLTIKSTFLGAHAVPARLKNNRAEYIRELVEDMIPRAAQDGLADYIDVFCDRGFFTPEETDILLEAGRKHGLVPKIHANELGLTGGVQAGVRNHALSVDHLEHLSDAEIETLRGTDTMPTLLPSTAFFLNLPYPPARAMIQAGLPVALATDFNPGSSPSGNMPFILSLAATQMKMTPEESIAAATLNGAYAMGLESTHGSISPGKKASFFITSPSLAFLPYSFGQPAVEATYINGIKVWSAQ
jgi:imidazolonepropionase